MREGEQKVQKGRKKTEVQKEDNMKTIKYDWILAGLLLILLYKGWKREGEDRILILGSSLVMTVMLLINVLVNFRMIPFGIIPSFMPLMTYNTGDEMISLIMLLIPIALLIRPKEKHPASFA